MSPAYIQSLISVAADASAAGHGKKEAIYIRACEQLGISRATLLAHIKKVAQTPPRKRRTDAGSVELPLAEAQIISAYLMEGYRKNNRKITTLKEALSVLRANNAVLAAVIDETTSEIRFLSESAVANGLRAHTLHPDQLRQATPHTNLQSLHPNHVWQIDASVCVIYYLPDGGAALVELDEAVHYKNKPENMRAIEQFRVIRYVATDHASGTVRYRYYPHSESGENTVRFMAWAMAEKGGNDPFHGAPLIVMVDPGATSGGLVKRFCLRMGITLIVNRRKNARGKGQVEKGNHQVETSFEQSLRYLKPRPASFDDINALAGKYQLWWNATKIHSRHGKTRFAAWMTITPEQLRTTPSAAVLLSLATQEPVRRVVNGDLMIEFKTRYWDVRDVPGVLVKGDVFVHWHPFIANTAMAVVWGDDGSEVHIALPERKRNELGFYEDAAIIGQNHKARADTIADTNRKLIQRIAAGTTTLAETEKKRELKNYLPFNGDIDPLKESKGTLPIFIAKRGTPLEINAPQVELAVMNTVQMAKWLKGKLGGDYQPELFADLQRKFPEGATETQLEQVLIDLQRGLTVDSRAKLKAV